MMSGVISILSKRLAGGVNVSSSFRPSIKVSVCGIAIGIGIMVLTLCIVIGFKDAITDKVAGFGNHLQIVNFEYNNTHEMSPIYYTDALIDSLSHLPHVAYVAPFVTREGIIKTDSLFQTAVIKGLDDNITLPCWLFFEKSITDGSLPKQKNEVIISHTMSERIQKKVGDDVLFYFMDNNVRVRKFHICGIYETGLVDFDKSFVLSTISGLQQINHWEKEQVSGIEISVDKIQNINSVDDDVFAIVANKSDKNGNIYFIRNLIKLNPQIFSWLDLLDMNVKVILVLMCFVSLFNVICGLVILLLEHIRFIGIMKVLGAENRLIKRIFVLLGIRMIGKGMLLGNIISLLLCAIQFYTQCIPMDASVYYVNYVPISFPVIGIIIVNIAMFAISFITLLLPVMIVSKIEPVSIIKFD